MVVMEGLLHVHHVTLYDRSYALYLLHGTNRMLFLLLLTLKIKRPIGNALVATIRARRAIPSVQNVVMHGQTDLLQAQN